MHIPNTVIGLKPVTSTEYTVGKSYNFHSEGLFSEIIFGSKESGERGKTFSFIELYCKILHPALVKPISQLNRKVISAISRELSYSINSDGFLTEDPNGEINSITAIYNNFEKIFNKDEQAKRRKDLKNMILSYFKKGHVFIDKCIVMPARWRDAEIDEIHGGLRTHPINEYYLKIIRQAMQLQSMSLTEGPMFDILSTKMQLLTNELYDYLVNKISKKEGLIRQNILGKRADFTGRAVITGGSSKIKVDEIGIPLRILVKLFEPFILHDLFNTDNVNKDKLSELVKLWDGSALSILSLRSLLTSIHRGFKIPDELNDIIKGSINRVLVDKVVMAKRDPALHAESVQGFKPVLIDGDTIQLSILKCSSYNADFDGDQMAIYVPLTREAIEEARSKMVSSESRDSLKSISDDFSKDMVIGAYALTQDSLSKKAPISIKSDDELKKIDPLDIVRYDGQVTTAGRILFNKTLPAKKYYINKAMDKSEIKKLATLIYNDYKHDKSVYIKFCDDLVRLSMYYYTVLAPSFTLKDLMDVSPKILKLKEQLKNSKTIVEAGKIMKQLENELKEYTEFKRTNIGVIGKAGGLKNGYNQVTQIVAAKGLIDTPSGMKVISGSFSDGFNSSDYFLGGHGARKGIADRVLNTSDTGYLSRQLVYALQRVEAHSRIKDCKTKRFLTIKATADVARRLDGRYILDDSGKVIPFDSKKYLDQVIYLRSPLYCISKEICATCYGDLLLRNRTKYVGILAAQICGEVLTQTIMRTFHEGGSVSMKSVDILSDISSVLKDSDKHFLMKHFKQEGSKLLSNIEGKIEIVKNDYQNLKKDIIISSDIMNLNYSFFTLFFLGYALDVTIDNKTQINLKDKKFIETDEKYIIHFDKNSEVFECVPTPAIFSEQIKVIDATLSGRTPVRLSNADHFMLKIYNIYKKLSSADLVHFEILTSNLLRDKGNPSYPARLNVNYSPSIFPLKSVCGLESWLQALAFENPKDAITKGLVYDRPTDETILEKLITGGF